LKAPVQPTSAETGPDGAAYEPDGRRRRSQDSRARIVAAMLELVQAGDVDPGAERVAAQAQVGLRTVFRHFKDMDSLYREMATVVEGELEEVLKLPLQGDTWKGQLADLIARRAVAFEKIGPYKRASNVHRHASRHLEAQHAMLVDQSRIRLKALLPDEIAGDPLALETLDLLLSFEAWSRLRQEQGLTPKRAKDVVTEAVARVIGG
jgi:AcrR family transcriptional regulator